MGRHYLWFFHEHFLDYNVRKLEGGSEAICVDGLGIVMEGLGVGTTTTLWEACVLVSLLVLEPCLSIPFPAGLATTSISSSNLSCLHHPEIDLLDLPSTSFPPPWPGEKSDKVINKLWTRSQSGMIPYFSWGENSKFQGFVSPWRKFARNWRERNKLQITTPMKQASQNRHMAMAQAFFHVLKLLHKTIFQLDINQRHLMNIF